MSGQSGADLVDPGGSRWAMFFETTLRNVDYFIVRVLFNVD